MSCRNITWQSSLCWRQHQDDQPSRNGCAANAATGETVSGGGSTDGRLLRADGHVEQQPATKGRKVQFFPASSTAKAASLKKKRHRLDESNERLQATRLRRWHNNRVILRSGPRLYDLRCVFCQRTFVTSCATLNSSCFDFLPRFVSGKVRDGRRRP